jgi:formyltetrahydrofolate synthetase
VAFYPEGSLPVTTVGLAAQASQISYGSVTSPGIAALITAVTPTVAGIYQVQIVFGLGGTVSASDLNNIKLLVNGSTKSILGLPAILAGGGSEVEYILNIAWTAGSIAIEAVALATTGAIYTCNLIVTQVG